MEIKNGFAETLLIQISGYTSNGIEPIGLLNFTSSLKGKLRRKLQYLSEELTSRCQKINVEKDRIYKIEDPEERQKELTDLMEEKFTITGFEKIPLSWIDEIETSKYINIKFLLEYIIFDDTQSAT